ncbi:MAG: sugar phosphate isomerase/epimerase [Lentisphaerae bacterium]|nr:sugar phosphate isomerase/epimerase [Lentisphaerota bacterium]
MNLSRRTFLGRSAGAVTAAAMFPQFAAAAGAKIKVGACVVGLAQAKAAGLEGVEIRAGDAADVLEIGRPEKRAQYKKEMQETGLPICSIMMGLLNGSPLATDPRGPAWLEQTIDGAKDLGAKNILVAFFSKGDLLGKDNKLKEDEFASVVKRIKAAAPRAKDAGVLLAIESLINAEQNERLLDAVDHESVSVYYDVYNLGKSKGYDAPAEIRRLKGRISQVHYKNGKQYLDDDKPFFTACSQALKDIHYNGWIVLETSSPSKDGVADAKRNGDFTRSLF